MNFTSSAVNSPKPLWNWTPLRRWNVIDIPSGAVSQRVARSRSTMPVPGLSLASPLNRLPPTCWLEGVRMRIGSRVTRSVFMPTRIVSAFDAAAGCNPRRKIANSMNNVRRNVFALIICPPPH